jgi:hypothetical protein
MPTLVGTRFSEYCFEVAPKPTHLQEIVISPLINIDGGFENITVNEKKWTIEWRFPLNYV